MVAVAEPRALRRRLLDAVPRGLRHRGIPVVLLACIAALDLTIVLVSPPYSLLAFLDEPAHLSTTGIALAAALRVRRLPIPFVTAALAASVLIDVDHVPQVLGSQLLTSGTPRPYSHALFSVVLFAAGSALTPQRRSGLRAALAGVCAGVALHLWRDLGTGQVSLWWPLTKQAIGLPYLLYFATLAALAVWCWLASGLATGRSAERAAERSDTGQPNP